MRRLRPIEIAEGALLADVAIIFQLLTLYLPVGGELFRVPIFVIFAILVLRRGFYVGLMGMCVAIFILTIITGFHGVSMMFLEGAGGIFLGTTMRWRLPHLLLILLGSVCGALTLWLLLFFFVIISGQPLDIYVVGLHTAYDQVMNLLNAFASRFGIGLWWKQDAVPPLAYLADLGFRLWPLVMYLALFLILCPVVAVIYVVSNLLVRRFGYDVRPLTGGWTGKKVRRVRRLLLRWRLRERVARRLKARGI